MTESADKIILQAMSAGSKTKLAASVAAARFAGRHRPLLVAWSVTNRCNLRCLYCESPHLKTDELTLEQGLKIIDEAAEAGTAVFSFTGGEPLIHKHIFDYIEHTLERGMKVGITTNGVLVPKMIDRLKKVSFIKLSLDGPPELHDKIRGGDCAKHVFEALELAHEHHIGSTLLAVLTEHNLDQIDYLVDTARKYRTTISFQPATGHLLKSDKENPVTADGEAYRKAIDQIIEKKHGPDARLIGNSVAGLRHLRRWPEPTAIACHGMAVSCRIEPDGRVYHCGRMIRHMEGPSAVELGFMEAFKRLPKPACDFCWCTHRVETNLILGLKPSAVYEAVRTKLL